MPSPLHALVDCRGRPIPVTNVVDLPERLPPADFWSRIPAASSDEAVAASSVWSYPLLRRHFFAVDVSTPARVHDFHSGLPVVPSTLGVVPDLADPTQRVVVAGDIAHRPIVTAHPPTTGSYSTGYYPRRTGDWLENDYLPAYAMTSDPRISERMSELLEFMLFSQYRDDGSNSFTATHFPQDFADAYAAGLTREWAGGWDYLFDWEWLDAYGYRWHLHEPDHHVNSQLASTMVRAYELTGAVRCLDAAKRFVVQQVPRYGFHSGVWNGETYYWTEYNPSGPGNPHRDATDNIQALVAQSVAMVGHHSGDRRLLEYARGLVWHCIREWVTDGRWYYDSAENPLNSRMAISHDMAVLLPLLASLPYLLKSGVRLDAELEVINEAYDFYLTHYPHDPMTRVRNGQLSKLAPERIDGQRSRATSYFTANQAGNRLMFADTLPLSEAVRPAHVDLQIAHVTPPRRHGEEWNIDPAGTRSTTISADLLAQGVPIEGSLQPGAVVRLSYTYSDRAERWSTLVPSEVRFTDPTGATRSVTATTPTAEFPTDVTPSTYARAATRLFCPDADAPDALKQPAVVAASDRGPAGTA